MTRQELIEAIISESKYRDTLTRLAKRFDTSATDFDPEDGGVSMRRYFPRHQHLPVVARIRDAARDLHMGAEAEGTWTWGHTLKYPRKGEGLKRAIIKVHSRKAKLGRQGYGPEMDRWKILKNTPVPEKAN